MFKRIRDERGFTLVELLVVLAILAILIAIVVPNLAGLTGGAQETACDTELDIVQSAMDTLMTQKNAVTVTEVTSAIHLDKDYDITYWTHEGKVEKYGKMLLRDTTHGKYIWDTTGKVTQDSCP